MTLNNKKGFTLVELLVVIFIISIVLVMVLPQLSLPQARAYDAAAKSNLRSVFTTCQDFWTFNSSNSPCLLTTVSNNQYGLILPADVEVTIESNANNTEYDFQATASHISSSNIFVIDYRGVLSKARGCSEKAHNDPKSLGQNAAGGCR